MAKLLGYGPLLLLGAVLGSAGTIVAYTSVRPQQIPDGLGPLVQGIGNVLLGAVTLGAAYKAAQFARETYVRWEERHLREKQFEVGAEAYGAALDICDLMQSIAYKKLPSPPPENAIEQIDHWRSLLLSNAPIRFQAAYRLVEVYLPDSALVIFADIASNLHALTSDLDMARGRARSFGGKLPHHSAHLTEFKDLRIALERIRVRLRQQLRPFILFESRRPTAPTLVRGCDAAPKPREEADASKPTEAPGEDHGEEKST